MTAPRPARGTRCLLVRLAAGAAAGVLAAALLGTDVAVYVVAVSLIAVGMAVTVPVPWGGEVPLGHGVVVVVVASGMGLPEQVAVTSSAVAVVLAETGLRSGFPALARGYLRLVPAVAAAVAAGAALTAVAPAGPVGQRAALAAAALSLVDAAVARTRVFGDYRIEARSAAPVYLTVGCVATLVAVTLTEAGPVMATAAALPMFVVRFSFQRYADANHTLEQTVLALGLVPELIGLADAGESERVATYADRLAEALGLDRATRQRVVIASRLHRLGTVRFDDDPDSTPVRRRDTDPTATAVEGARILRTAGFPDEIADLVEAARAGALDAPPSCLPSTVVRVAVAFDAVVGDDSSRARHGVAHIRHWATSLHSRRTAAALAQLVNNDPSFVAEAVAAGERFRDTSAHVDLQLLLEEPRPPAMPLLRWLSH